MTHLAKNLRFLAAEAGLKQSALGKALGIEQSTVQRIMAGTTEYPRLDSVLAIASYFGCSLDDLVHRDIQSEGINPSQPARRDDANLAQAVELLHMLADLRPDDARFRRISWHAIQVTAKAIAKAEGSQKEAVRMILEDLTAEV